MSSFTQTSLPDNEAARLAAVRRYDILDTPPDGAFERVTRLASHLLGTPISIVTIVDHDRIWFKSKVGLDVTEIERSPGLCASAILGETSWIVEDARRDPRTLANPLVAGSFGLQFYAGSPLRTHDGYNLGTLCVIDREPRQFTEDEQALLEDLAAIVVDELELRLAARRAETAAAERTTMLDARERMAVQINDDVVQSIAVAKLALETGNLEMASVHLDGVLSAAKLILAELGETAPTLRRSHPGAD